jgi:hypothetical protein
MSSSPGYLCNGYSCGYGGGFVGVTWIKQSVDWVQGNLECGINKFLIAT